eukprot:503020-Pleurochrysis_carterae.AAC.2
MATVMLLLRALSSSASMSAGAKGAASGLYALSAHDLDSNAPVNLDKYNGKVSLVVNVASK